MGSLEEHVRIQGGSASNHPDPGPPVAAVGGYVADLLEVPTFSQRVIERDVSRETARKLSSVVFAAASAVTFISLLGLAKPTTPTENASLLGLVAIAFLCGMLAGAWVWLELTTARAFGARSRLRFIASYSLGGALVGSLSIVLLPLAGFTSVGPPVLRIVSLAVVTPWLAVIIGLLFDGRARVRVARQLLIDRAVSVTLKGTTKAALLEDLRSSVRRDLQTALEPAFRIIDERLAFEQVFAKEHVDTAAANVLRDLADTSVRPLSRLLNEQLTGRRTRFGPIAFVAGVASNQRFRPGLVSAIFVLTAVVERWTVDGPMSAFANAASGIVLIFLILGSGNWLMRAFPQRHTAIFLATVVVLQIPTFSFELAAGASLTPLYIVHVIVGIFLSACVIWLTSGIGEFRVPQAELLRVYARELDAARIDVLVQTEVIGSIAKDAARMLHGSVQSKLAACALAIDRAALTDDVESYAAAIEQARAVLNAPWMTDSGPRPSVTLQAEVNAKIELWQGLAGIAALVSPEVKQITGALAGSVGEVVEEGLCNAIRHGNADTVSVQVDLVDEGSTSLIRVRVVDDGCGPLDGAPGLGSALLDDACAGRWKRAAAPGGGCILDAWILVREVTAS